MNVMSPPAVKKKGLQGQATASNPYVNTNVDFYDTFDNEGNRIIYSTLDELVIGPEDLAIASGGEILGIAATLTVGTETLPLASVTIYALNLKIKGSLRLPGRKVSICAKQVSIQKGIAAAIDVSTVLGVENGFDYAQPDQFAIQFAADIVPPPGLGERGQSGDVIAESLRENKNMRFGAKGVAGGTISVLCEVLVMEDALTLSANGSTGYPGADGQQGAKGGYGADEVARASANRAEHGMMTTYSKETITPPGRGQTGARGGDAGRGGEGGDGGTIQVAYHTIQNASQLIIVTQGGPGGTYGKVGTGGVGGDGGRVASVAYTNGAVSLKERIEATGYQGPPGRIPQPPAGLGNDGVFTIFSSNAASKVLGQNMDSVLYLKLLQKIKIWYLYYSPLGVADGKVKYPDETIWNRIGEHLDWVVDTLQFCVKPDQQKTLDNLRKYDIFSQAVSLQTKHNNNLTYYGHVANYVPRATLKALSENLRDSFQTKLELEKKYTAMALQYQAGVSGMISREVQESILKAHVESYQALYQQTLHDALQIRKDIEAINSRLAEAVTDVKHAGKKLVEAVTGYFDCAAFFEVVMGALEMLAFTGISGEHNAKTGKKSLSPESKMGMALQSTKILKGAYDSFAKFTTADGRSVDKAYLIQEIDTGQDDLAKQSRDYVTKYLDNGQISDDGMENLKLILTDVGKLEEIVREIGDKADTTAEVAAIKKMKDVVLAKGDAIVAYNASVSQFYTYVSMYQEATERLEKLQGDQESIHPYVTSTVSYYGVRYQLALEQAMESLYLINRKSYYLTFNDILGGGIMRTDSGHGLGYTTKTERDIDGLWTKSEAAPSVTTIAENLNEIYAQLGKYENSQTSARDRFGNGYSGFDIEVVIQGQNMIQDFISNKKIAFSTTHETPQTYSEFKVTGIDQMYDIRITQVQPVIHGLQRKLYALTAESIANLRKAVLPIDLIATLDRFKDSPYPITPTENVIFSRLILSGSHFSQALIQALPAGTWAEYEPQILNACLSAKTNADNGTDNGVQVTISNSGTSVILGKTDPSSNTILPFHFAHQSVHAISGFEINNTDKRNNGMLSDQTLGAIGIFGSWLLALHDSADRHDPNYGLVLDKVNAITIHFTGQHRTK